jgi:hypothetical protein
MRPSAVCLPPPTSTTTPGGREYAKNEGARERRGEGAEQWSALSPEQLKHAAMRKVDGRFTTIPNSRDICTGTLKAILRQFGLSNEQFIR